MGRGRRIKAVRLKPPLEWEYQKRIMSELRLAGWRVYNTSEGRARTTASPGIPDLICFHTLTGTLLFIEVKRPQYVGAHGEEIWTHPPETYLRDEQKEFADLVATVQKTLHLTGATDAVLSFIGTKIMEETHGKTRKGAEPR